MFRMTAQSQSVSTALIHSVVVLNISDQWTRLCVQNGSPQPVFGALLGKQTGRNIEIWNSFELKSTSIEIEGKQKRHLIEEEYFLQRCILFKETYADLDFLGFYVCGDHEKTTDEDIHLQRQAWPHNESPFLLKFNAAMPIISDKVAISIFDSSLDPSDENRLIFQSIPVKIVSEMAEQIGLDHVARYSKTGATAESTASKQMGAQFGAINTFIHGLTIAHDYVQAVKAGEVDRDEAILREIHKLCMKLSVHGVQTHKEIEKDNLQISDHKLLILLSALCTVQGSMFNLVEKVNVLAKEHLHRERSSMVQHPTSILGLGRIAGSNFPRFFF